MQIRLLPAFFILMFAASFYSQAPPIGPGVSHDLAVWRAARYSDVRYKLNLTLEKMSPVLKGTIEIRVKVSGGSSATAFNPDAMGGTIVRPEDRDVPPIILDWRKIRGHETDSTTSNVTLNGIALRESPSLTVGPSQSDAEARVSARAKDGTLAFEESNDHLIFRDGVVEGENVIKLDFTSPILTSGSSITRYIDKEDGSEYLYSLFVPSDASTAFPVFDQPDLKARFQLIVTAPKDWNLISNSRSSGMLISDCFHGGCSNETHFFTTRPISTYVFAFAAGPWAPTFQSPETVPESSAAPSGIVPRPTVDLPRSVFDEEDRQPYTASSTRVYVRKSQLAKFQPHAAEVFRLTREGVKYLEGYFDYKFPFPKYDLVLIPEFPFGGMEHAGATFVREQSIIFPTEPTKSDYINRATLIFHETAHQWFGDTVTMKWFDDLWLKEGFANFMAYKAMEKIMPEMNAWKVFYERIKQPAYATDSTKGTTPIYQPIANLSAAKSAYGNIVYNKAPAFLRQAEFYLGEDKFQTAVRAFLKKHEYANATWEDLVKEFEAASGQDLKEWASVWVKQKGVPTIVRESPPINSVVYLIRQQDDSREPKNIWTQKIRVLYVNATNQRKSADVVLTASKFQRVFDGAQIFPVDSSGPEGGLPLFVNFQDYGYGIFLLGGDFGYVADNVASEKDDFLRSMMYGALWDSVRAGEVHPDEYLEPVLKNLPTEQDENIVASILGHASTAMNYYLSEHHDASLQKPDRKEGRNNQGGGTALANARASAPGGMRTRLENVLIDRMKNASTPGQRITFYRAFLSVAESENARGVLKGMLAAPASTTPAAAKPATAPIQEGSVKGIPLKAKDKFDIVTRLASLGDPDAPKLLADLEKTETSDDAKRYAYAAHAAFATKENREKFWNDFVNNKQISESWIEAAMGPFNSVRHDDLSLPYLQRALAELPNLKRDRKIFFVNGWLGAFIGGQKSQQALDIVNKFLADNPNLDNDLRLKILENVDVIERAVKIRTKFGK